MKNFKCIFVLLAILLLVSCARLPIIERIKPPTTAVVFLGSYGDISWSSAETTDPNNNFTLFRKSGDIRKGKKLPRFHHVLAIPVTVGSNFTITQLRRSSKSSSLEVDVNWPKLKINKEGIYYLGLVTSIIQGANMVNVSFSQTSKKDESIDIAKLLYPKVFKKLQPVNF